MGNGGRKSLSHTLLVPFRRYPFGGWRHHLSPGSAGDTMGAGHFRQFEFMAVTEGKPYNRASPVEMHPFCRLRRRLSTGKRLTRFSGRCAPLRIVFACHPGGGDFSGAMPCDTYEAEWEAESKLPSPGEVPPQAGIGVHFQRARRRGLPVFHRPQGRFYGFTSPPAHQYTSPLPRFYQNGAAGAHIHLLFTIHHLPFPHGRPPQPSEPSEPSDPKCPSILRTFFSPMTREALINSQNRISYVFLSNATS